MAFSKFQTLCWLAGLTLICACKKDSDSGPALPTLSIASESFPEGGPGNSISVKVSISAASSGIVKVYYSTVDATAKAGEDFTGKTNAELVFAAGETEKNIVIPVTGDDVIEADETFQVLLSDPSGATLDNYRATITLLNDDVDDSLVIPASGYSTPETYPGKTLVWSDEFNATSLDLTAWTHETGAGGWGNNELQYYRPENTYLTAGNLIIEARKENFGGASYTSSRLITKGKKDFTFGRIDIRAALPEGQGIWPALWMLGSNINSVSWPACGEIDIMELVGHEPNRVHGTAHCGADFSQHLYKGSSKTLPAPAKFSDEFHVFSIIWEQDNIRWLIDDEPFFEIKPGDVSPATYPFNKPFFFIFNVAVGGNWPGSPNNTTVFPQRMIVDYVRVFQ